VIDEVVEARMLIGVHFRSADEDGADIGRGSRIGSVRGGSTRNDRLGACD
jgi:hypothetical protein